MRGYKYHSTYQTLSYTSSWGVNYYTPALPSVAAFCHSNKRSVGHLDQQRPVFINLEFHLLFPNSLCSI
ncbi:hypothetical protein CAEBREN_02212 [Caenorhabditis brenneri]|uniref:Uncharacterized protein n=1 Tax=Caenorhabditis brenneri TaxID=135651 RepID=G0N671_CAEBE|nr:hypothetical protein CAEBREN_02212 [Caenorhabditis brenneri]